MASGTIKNLKILSDTFNGTTNDKGLIGIGGAYANRHYLNCVVSGEVTISRGVYSSSGLYAIQFFNSDGSLRTSSSLQGTYYYIED